MTIVWSTLTAPVPTTGLTRVFPIPVDAAGYITDINFLHRINTEFPDFFLSDTTSHVLLTDSSGYSRGQP